MWFGDLVTMKWWNGIWLNEAFATFMEHLGVDAYQPDWKTWDDFALGRAAALDVDALANTRTVEYEVITPEDADGMFDLLTYQKGGSVLRMLERWLGADAFRAGVRALSRPLPARRTPRRPTCGTRSESATEQAGAPHHGLVDLPTRLPADLGRDRRHEGDARPSSGSVTSPPTARQRWVDPGSVTRAHRRVRRRHARCSSKAPRRRSTYRPTRWSCSTRAARASTASRTRATWRDRLLDAGVLEPLERFSLVDDLWAAVLAGRRDRPPSCSRWRARFAGETDLVVWRVLVERVARHRAARRRRRAHPVARRVGERARARLLAPRLGTGARGRPAHPPAPRGRARRARHARRGPGGDRAGARDGRGRGRATPTWPPRRSRSWPRRATPARSTST